MPSQCPTCGAPTPTPPKKEKKLVMVCSFCGKTEQEVRKLIAGPKAMICDECVGLCNDILTSE